MIAPLSCGCLIVVRPKRDHSESACKQMPSAGGRRGTATLATLCRLSLWQEAGFDPELFMSCAVQLCNKTTATAVVTGQHQRQPPLDAVVSSRGATPYTPRNREEEKSATFPGRNASWRQLHRQVFRLEAVSEAAGGSCRGPARASDRQSAPPEAWGGACRHRANRDRRHNLGRRSLASGSGLLAGGTGSCCCCSRAVMVELESTPFGQRRLVFVVRVPTARLRPCAPGPRHCVAATRTWLVSLAARAAPLSWSAQLTQHHGPPRS